MISSDSLIWNEKNTICLSKTTSNPYSAAGPAPLPPLALSPLPTLHTHTRSHLPSSSPSAMSPDSALCNILRQLFGADPSDHPAILSAATSHLLSRTPADAEKQLLYQRPNTGYTSLILLAVATSCSEAAPLLTVMLERGREYSSTTNQLDLRDSLGMTPMHYFAYCCPHLTLTKKVLLEHPPSLAVLDIYGCTPLHFADNVQGDPEITELLRDATAAFMNRDFVAIERICGGSSPYLSRELGKQATALRVAVNICLKRQEEAPSDLISPETGVALALLGLVRDIGRDRHSSDLLRRVLEYVGPYVTSCDARSRVRGTLRDFVRCRLNGLRRSMGG